MQEAPKVSIYHESREARAWWEKKPFNCVGTAHSKEENSAHIRENKGKEENTQKVRQKNLERERERENCEEKIEL